MFYIVLDNTLKEYGDYKFSESCKETNLCTMDEYIKEPNKFMLENDTLVLNPNYEQEQAEAREKQFKNEFFQTSLGWIRRKVNMKDGSVKDFLADLLLPIKAGLELGQKVVIITYKTPDFTKDYNEEYIVSLQERKEATADFIQECLMQTVADFGG